MARRGAGGQTYFIFRFIFIFLLALFFTALFGQFTGGGVSLSVLRTFSDCALARLPPACACAANYSQHRLHFVLPPPTEQTLPYSIGAPSTSKGEAKIY